MMSSLGRQLTIFLLVVGTVLAPLNLIAHDLTSVAAKDGCVCHLQLNKINSDTNENLPGNHPLNNNGDCCDNGECFSDAMEPPLDPNVKFYTPQKQLFHLYSNKKALEVYLALFVPPES